MADGIQVEGVDYAFSRPNIAQLAALGKVFACRYGGPGSSTKHLTPEEARALSAAGISVVANAEGAADGMLGGWNAGVSWATSAETHFRTCGMPAGRPIYLSADFDVTSAQWPTVANALRGAASVLGAARVGVYGGRRAIEWARRDGVAAWFWQTYAWSGGVWVPGNHCEQYRNGVDLAGGTLDLDRALKSDYGQWTIGDTDVTPADVKDIWQHYLAPNGANMQDHLLGAEGAAVNAAAGVKQLLDRPPVQPTPIDLAMLTAAMKATMQDPEVLGAIAKAVVAETARELTD